MLSNVKIDSKSIVNLSLAVEYQSVSGKHKDILHFEKFNVWRDADLLPPEVQKKLLGKSSGYKEKFSFSAGEITSDVNKSLLYEIRNADFNRRPREKFTIEPRFGRYYPKGWFNGINDNYSENMFPARLVHIDENIIAVDFNHPLAIYDLTIEIEVFNVYQSFDEHGGRCNDCLADLLSGPGMQLRHQNRPTDFFVDNPFRRPDEADDGLFYSMPRMVNHLDNTALEQVKLIYSELIPDKARILDLMSSVNSHLPDEINASYVAGLGMNQQELEANSALHDKIIHDLNDDPVLPFDDASFDVVLCNVSVEYLNKPIDVFRDVSRILSSGGIFITTFSNRWFPTKAIQLWINLHEFERMGLVSEYFMSAGQFKDISTRSVRGLPRPEDDRHQVPLSDPVYAVWGYKK